MRTPANIAKHPIHPMLVPIPIGLWVFSLICDLVFVFGGGSDNWAVVAYYTMVGGVIGALVAAVPGFVDMLSLPPGPRRTALGQQSRKHALGAEPAAQVGLGRRSSRPGVRGPQSARRATCCFASSTRSGARRHSLSMRRAECRC